MSVYSRLSPDLKHRWWKLRSKWLKHHPLCAACLVLGKQTKGDVVDHVVPHRGNEQVLLNESNLQTLCHACHSSGKQRSEHRGYDIAMRADGLPSDPRHPWNLKT